MNNMKRTRGRNFRSGGGGGQGGGGGGGGPIRHNTGNIPLNRNHVFDSNGPDMRIRGTSQQLFEKYLQMGRDATSSGDRVMAESYFQHAEHYFRIINAMNQAAQQQQPNGGGGNGGQPIQQQPQQNQRRGYEDGQNGYGGPNERSDDESEDGDRQPVHHGDEQPEARDIPIAATPPENLS